MQRQQAESDQYRAADWAISSTPLTIPTPETALTYTLYGNSGLIVKAGEAPRSEEGALRQSHTRRSELARESLAQLGCTVSPGNWLLESLCERALEPGANMLRALQR
ncbi:hypothetical protein C1896_01145 [Pseudomonadaceae bacterium SI-3]|nr:hypothetical protein C1896_01145 [Pseudomonadaceae bacterium SI-3]